MKFSIIVITRNRAACLLQVLKSLIGQETKGEAYEIIVVDNNSKDATASVIKEFNQTSGDRVRYVFEPEIGMSKARNKGAATAKGEILVFIDDDAIASPNWLNDYYSLYEMFPDIIAGGGKIDLLFQSCRPKWLSDDLLVPLGYLNISDKETILSFPDYPFGGNFSVKKEMFMKVGGFIENLRNSNEERGFFYKLHVNKYKVGYTPKALVYHQIPASRLRKIFFIKRGIKQGIGNIKFISQFDSIRILRFKEELNQLLFDGLIIVRNILIYRGKYPFAQMYYFCIRWGELLGIMMRGFVKNEYCSYSHTNETS